MRCLGITGKNRRCLREGNPFFCPEHAPQPYIAFVGGIIGFLLSVGASLLANHLDALSTELELQPSDFDVQVSSSRHGGQQPFQYEPTELLDISIVIGSTTISSTLELEPRGVSAYGGGRNPWQTWYYPSKRLNVTFNKNQTFESLVGETIWAKLPLRALYPKSRNKLRVWIKGKEISLEPMENGEIKHVITAKELGING